MIIPPPNPLIHGGKALCQVCWQDRADLNRESFLAIDGAPSGICSRCSSLPMEIQVSIYYIHTCTTYNLIKKHFLNIVGALLGHYTYSVVLQEILLNSYLECYSKVNSYGTQDPYEALQISKDVETS